ncbi:MAG: flavodoxin domain-containing protein [Myxococcota bacterium]|nr:flavodoxin domain-containing protein [Myxococcota bacterium]
MTTINILYGTETYNSEGLAQRTGDLLEAEGWPVDVLDMDDIDPTEIVSMSIILVITSTFGDGDPPSNAEALHAFLMASDAPRLAGLHFSVCALGDTDYQHFCQCGKDFDARLEALGGHRMAPRVDCDTDFEDTWSQWTTSVLMGLRLLGDAPLAASQASASMSAMQSVSYQDDELDDLESMPPASEILEPHDGPNQRKGARQRSPVGTRKNPFFGHILENENLNDAASEKETRHVAISIRGSGMRYQVGDTLGVFPRNCPDLVRRILQAAQIPRDTPVFFDGEWFTIRDVLIYRKDVNNIDRRLVNTLVNDDERSPLGAILRDREVLSEYMAEHHVLDCLMLAGRAVQPQDFLACLRPLAPRQYSIASSPLVYPDEVHLTIDVVRYDLHGMPRKGVSSTFFADRAGPGVEVAVYVQPTKHFHLCDDEMPIILIGPGTGIAPFRAFLLEREARGAPGQSWVFFGSRRAAHDFLYREELLAWVRTGIIARLDTAWSRDQLNKIYVQDRLYENGPAIWHWLEAGAYVYVCGDASKMAKDVHAMLIRIVEEFGQFAHQDAVAFIENLSATGRYLRDIY